MFLRPLLFVVAFFLPTLVWGETLLETYKLAYQNDPKYHAAQAESRASGTAIDQAHAGFMPTAKFDVEAWSTRQEILSSNNPIFGTGATSFPTHNKTLSVTQPIFRMDLIDRLAQAKAVVRQAEFALLAAEQDLQLRTTSAYLMVLAARDSLALASAEREAVGKALELARERLRMGLGTITNQHDAAARYGVSKAREIEARDKLRDAREGLREITGKLMNDMQSLRQDFPLETPDPAVVERWVKVALEQNLTLRARREGVEVARQEVERQKAGHWPSVNLLMNLNRRDAGSTLYGGGSEVETADMILRLSIPIYEGGMTSAVTKEAAYRYQKAREESEQERRAVERATRAAYDSTLSGTSLVKALRETVASQEATLEAKEQGFRSGLLTLLPVLDAQRDLYLAKRDYAQARYDYLVNRLKLKQAAGTLSEADLVTTGSALESGAKVQGENKPDADRSSIGQELRQTSDVCGRPDAEGACLPDSGWRFSQLQMDRVQDQPQTGTRADLPQLRLDYAAKLNGESDNSAPISGERPAVAQGKGARHMASGLRANFRGVAAIQGMKLVPAQEMAAGGTAR